MNDLETSLAQQAPPNPESSMLYDLPPLAVDGIPTALDKMTQVVCKNFLISSTSQTNLKNIYVVVNLLCCGAMLDFQFNGHWFKS